MRPMCSTSVPIAVYPDKKQSPDTIGAEDVFSLRMACCMPFLFAEDFPKEQIIKN